MNADGFRHLYGYHFAIGRTLWSLCEQLTDEQLGQGAGYSHGSVLGQLIHLISVDDAWFAELQGGISEEPPAAAAAGDRAALRAYWDAVEARVRGYLDGLRDEMLLSRPIVEPEEDRELQVWQVLLHVANHGTDHRAQLLRQLSDMGIRTPPQDYMFYVYEHL